MGGLFFIGVDLTDKSNNQITTQKHSTFVWFCVKVAMHLLDFVIFYELPYVSTNIRHVCFGSLFIGSM